MHTRIPMPPATNLPDLPILPYLAEIASRLAERGRLVLSAEPGAGKTSVVPVHLARDGRVGGKIIVLEPRRMATVAAAGRCAEIMGENLGASVGYRVKGDARTGRNVKIEFMTEGIFLRVLQSDPGLGGVGLVVFDEFHERSWQTDLGLALCLETCSLRSDLDLLVMSATLDTLRCSERIGAPVLSVPGKMYPVETRHRAMRAGGDICAAVAQEALGLLRECGGDVLAFLPGMAEIERTATVLAATGTGSDLHFTVRRLHSSIPLADQLEVLRPGTSTAGDSAAGASAAGASARPRIILATSIAETSLTVPGVRGVVDSGLARTQRFHPGTGLNRLVTEQEAGDRADQRRGRAGRTAPGICVRLWPAGEVLAEHTRPEIMRAELSSLVLETALWGARKPQDLPWMDIPPAPALESATAVLIGLGAIDPAGKITATGRTMAGLGTEPRLAAMILRGKSLGFGPEACRLAAFLGDAQIPASGGRDIDEGLAALTGKDRDRVSAEAARLAGLSGIPFHRVDGGNIEAGLLLSSAYPDRIARRLVRDGSQAVFQMPSGRKIKARGSSAESPWIVAAWADAGAGHTEGFLLQGASISEKDALEALSPVMTEAVEIEWEKVAFRARRRRRAGAILLSETPAGPIARDLVRSSFRTHLASAGLDILPWNEASRNLLGRIRAWSTSRLQGSAKSSVRPEAGCPPPESLSAENLADSVEGWLMPFVSDEPGGVLDERALFRALEGLIPAPLTSDFRSRAPAGIVLAGGGTKPLEYRADGSVNLEVRVHELFGLKKHPEIMGRPVVITMLSPAGRPVHITKDIIGFWQGSWKEVRSELKGRYPKHDWPENPASASPRGHSLKSRP